MKIFIYMLFTLTLVNAYWLDGDGDKTKSVLFLEYSDGTADRLVIDKKDLTEANISNLKNKVRNFLKEKEVSYGN